ncbi:hypothetical protein C1879_07165 [Paraeggerthella hongkongensis]|nr:hypothetical protein C1879_07165 [Paraeggerthella hongkongensis]
MIYRSFYLGIGARRFLITLSIISIASFVIETVSLMRYYGASYTLFGGAYYEYAETGRTMLDQILMSSMQLGTVSYLFMRADNSGWPKRLERLVICAFWTVGLFALLQGSRFSIAVAFVLFFVIENRRSSAVRKVVDAGKVSSLLTKMIVMVAGIVLLVVFVQLMETKLIYNTPLTKFEIMPGDQWLKPFWLDLYYSSNGAVESFYDFCDYLGEAPFVFAGFWDVYMPDQLYPFTNTLRPLSKLLNSASIPLIADPTFVDGTLTEGIARYTSFAWNLIIEFGLWGAPVASYLFGLVMSKIERYSQSYYFLRVISPCLIPMSIFAPIYFFNVGRLDWVLFEVVVVYAFLHLFSKGGFVKGEEIARARNFTERDSFARD